MKTKLTYPNGVTKDHMIFLNVLRESGRTNMFGSIPYIVRKFGMTNKDAKRVLDFWMHNFSEVKDLRPPEKPSLPVMTARERAKAFVLHYPSMFSGGDKWFWIDALEVMLHQHATDMLNSLEPRFGDRLREGMKVKP